MALNVVWVRRMLIVFYFAVVAVLVVVVVISKERKKREGNKAKMGERRGRGLIIQKELEEDKVGRGHAMLVN